METLDYDFTVFSSAAREADKNLAVRLFSMPLQDQDASTREGRPIFVDTQMIEIRVRGDRNNVIQRPVRPEDKQRFREVFAAHERGEAQQQTGTPLAQWPIMSAAAVEELKFLGFFTVEQLADARDDLCGKHQMVGVYKQKAKVYLEAAKGTAPLEKMHAENAELKSQVEVLSRTNDDMSKKLAELTEKFTALAEKVASKK